MVTTPQEPSSVVAAGLYLTDVESVQPGISIQEPSFTPAKGL